MLYKRVTARPSECMIVMRGGNAVNRGNGASANVWPWDSWALVPTNAIEHCFQMHQETSDGITLRFKGIVIYRVVRPEHAATLFRFHSNCHVETLSEAIADVCLGELRAIVAGMSMEQCIARRKTVLTGQLQDAVIPAIEGREGEPGWGVKIEVLQVAQVFCPDEKLLAQLQAEARDQIKKTASASDLETSRELELARLDSEGEVASRTLAIEKGRLDEQMALEQKKLATESAIKVAELENRRQHEEARIATESALKVLELESRDVHERKRIETEAHLRLMELERQIEIAEQELRLQEIRARINAITSQSEALRERARMEIRKEILPLEQLPQVSESLAGMFKDARLSIYADPKDGLVGSASNVVNMLFDHIKDAYQKPA